MNSYSRPLLVALHGKIGYVLSNYHIIHLMVLAAATVAGVKGIKNWNRERGFFARPAYQEFKAATGVNTAMNLDQHNKYLLLEYTDPCLPRKGGWW